MSRSVESSGKTIEQALQKALKELSAQPDEVDIEILEGASKGFLGGLFGTKSVSIRVTLRDTKRAENHIGILREIISNLLSQMGVDYELTIEEMPDTTFMNIPFIGVPLEDLPAEVKVFLFPRWPREVRQNKWA